MTRWFFWKIVQIGVWIMIGLGHFNYEGEDQPKIVFSLLFLLWVCWSIATFISAFLDMVSRDLGRGYRQLVIETTKIVKAQP